MPTVGSFPAMLRRARKGARVRLLGSVFVLHCGAVWETEAQDWYLSALG